MEAADGGRSPAERDHLEEVYRRLEGSRYEADRDELAALLGDLHERSQPHVWRRAGREPLPPARLLPPTVLRVATTPFDLERSAEVLSAAFGADLAVLRRWLGGNIHQVDAATVLLAERHGGNVVGTVTLVLTEHPGGLVAGVHLLAVAPSFRGRGIGTALAVRAGELAVATGADAVVLLAGAASAGVAERLGFVALRPVPPVTGS